jgi:hypothetical protein
MSRTQAREIDEALNDLVVRRKAAMHNAGITAVYVAKKLKIAQPPVSREVLGEKLSYTIRAAITYLTGYPHAWLWGEDAPAPTAEQAESLARRLGVRFCGRDTARPYKLVTQCWNCGHADGCERTERG